ncbi:hypothetical protein ACFO0N_15825 [Halobium salinum]|uniref:Nal1 N-terminal domain-containing protein n=1 Tax=Halobium salinum TaxID=1364940 RepID=A0ABD5PET3_9EURY|nr:hypothetical protein [Halobium salinum]
MDHIPDEVRDELEAYDNVVGTARGRKQVNGRDTGEEAIIVLVSRKLPDTQLDETQRLPRTVEVDGETVKIDVEEVGDPRPHASVRPAEPAKPDRKREWRPAPAGVSFGHPEITAGTLGSPPLRADEAGEPVVLTNAHVAAPIDAASEGDPILQPGPADGGTEEDQLGTLADYSQPTAGEPNETDSALVAVDPERYRGDVLGVGTLQGWTEGTMDDEYTKSGRTTGVTTGKLRGTDARVKVNGYHDEPTQFVGLDVFGPMSAGGDSGSIIGVEREDGLYGTDLLFAGSDRTTLGIPMETVQEVHGGLTPLDPGETGGGSGGGGGGSGGGGDDGSGGDGGDGGDGGEPDPDRFFRARVGNALRRRYGEVVRADAAGVDFRVETYLATLVVATGTTGDAALDAVGPVAAAADPEEVPVVVFPTGEGTDRLSSLDGRVLAVDVDV